MRDLTMGPSAAGRQRKAFAALLAPALLLTVAPVPAAAQSGEIIILRHVDARNAITPGTGEALTVKTTPDNDFFNTISGNLRLLSDADAALVSGGRPGTANLDGMVRFGLETAFGTQGQTSSINSEHSSAGTGIIGNSVSLGMGALQGALSTLRTSMPRGQ